ncbi:hypothetical protein [Kitasatospora camelliae]|uniref:Uncharacterized protein n=1 Tax=Kitasatospora camelliae TaxID=3156397 RepID=A0AAU8JNY8_9ACTN
MNGRSTLRVHTGSPNAGTDLYIATEGKPFPVKLTRPVGPTAGTASFSDFDAPVTVTEPPADQVVDLAAVGKPATT